MKKFGAFLARKTVLSDLFIESGLDPDPESADNPLELDEELFSAIGAQTGAEHESLRSLLLDVSTKSGELDGIKGAVDRLIEPVCKTLETIEAERTEKFALQTALNNTRTAYGKLRNEATECETRLNASLGECEELRRKLADAQSQLRSADAARLSAIDAAARRAQIVDLEARLAQETGESKALRTEKRRLEERLAAADKRIIALESDFDAARQRLLLTEDEKRTQQELLDSTSAETVRLSRKLAEAQTVFDTDQARLRQLDATVADLINERARLASALDEASDCYANQRASQRTRFDALALRAEASDKLLDEARADLVARNKEIRDYEERVKELTQERDGLQKALSDRESEYCQRESMLAELSEEQQTLEVRCQALNRAFTAKEVALERAEETINALKTRLRTVEQTLAADRQAEERNTEELGSALQREKMGHAVTQGALESARNELARAMRALMIFERERSTQQAVPPPAANAA
jgi:chromosome segregation ATPase